MALSAVKEFKVRFYELDVQQPEGVEALTPQDLFRRLKSLARGLNGLCPPLHSDGQVYEIRELRAHNSGVVFTGIFAVMRDDAPHIRKSNGDEEEIQLADEEGVLEKNHFIYYSAQSLLVYQINRRASHPTRLEQYLTAMAGLSHSVHLADILTTNAWEQLRNGQVRKVHVVISRPRNPERYDPEDFDGLTLNAIERSGATRAEINMSISGPERGMRAWVRNGLLKFRNRENVKSLRVLLDGDDKMLDLLANTVRDTIEVPMNGRYPNTRATFEELEVAKRRQQEALDEHFGP